MDKKHISISWYRKDLQDAVTKKYLNQIERLNMPKALKNLQELDKLKKDMDANYIEKMSYNKYKKEMKELDDLRKPYKI